MEKIYYKMNEKEHSMINEIMEITCYECEMFGDFILADELMNVLYELLYEYKKQKENFEDFKRDVEENYQYKNYETDPYDELGLNEKDFH